MNTLADIFSEQQVASDILPFLPDKTRPNPYLTGALFLLVDTLSLIAAVTMARLLWVSLISPGAPSPIYFWPAIILFWAIFWFKGLYPGIGMTPVEQLRRIVRSASLIFLFLITSIFLMKQGNAISRGMISLAWLFSICIIPFVRGLVCRLFSNRAWWGVPIVILGAGRTAKRLIKGFREKQAVGFKPIVCLDDDLSKLGYCENVPIIGSLSLAAELAKLYGIRHAVLAMPGVRRERMLVLLERCSTIFPHVILIPDLLGVSTLWVKARDLSGVLGLEMRFNLLIPFNRWFKRVAEFAVASIGLICALPLIILCIVVIKLTSPGPAIYFQNRDGLGGKTIRIPKLRTMLPDADKMLASYLREHPLAKAEWDRHCKLRNDPRIIPFVGRLLRRTSLDELPQLWCVIKGEMSLVGPRPFPSYHTKRFPRDFSELRQRVVPGITGLWQITDRSNADLNAQIELDSYYIRNWSIWMDIYILCRTIGAVITGKGAY